MAAAAPMPGLVDLPTEIPVFPLTGALLLPGGEMPLNIFEPRYLAMIDWALGEDRWLGMVQPRDTREQTVSDTHPMFGVGCLGRITQFSESGDGRYLITVSGRCRFDIADELSLLNGFRRIVPAYDAYACDLGDDTLDAALRQQLFHTLKAYLEKNGYEPDWQALENTPDVALVASMAMACPFEPAEKQALLEAEDLASRTRCLIAVLDMAQHDEPVDSEDDSAPDPGRSRH